jgi:hypothetical protein
MAWDVRQTYYYLVCFATLIMMIIGVVRAVENSLDLAFPEEPYRPTPMDMYERYPRPSADASEPPPYTREELEEMAADEADRMRRQARRRALRNLIGSIALISVAAPVYVYHWRHVRREDL